MCLRVDPKLTKRKLAQKNKTYIFYKSLRGDSYRDKFCLYSPYKRMRITSPYVSIEKRSVAKRYINGKALHLFTNKPDGETYLITVKVRVKKEDIIAFGKDNDVAVSAYKIPQKVWDRVKRNSPWSSEMMMKKLKSHIKVAFTLDAGSHCPFYSCNFFGNDIKLIDNKSSVSKEHVGISCSFDPPELADRVHKKLKKLDGSYNIFINYNTIIGKCGAILHKGTGLI